MKTVVLWTAVGIAAVGALVTGVYFASREATEANEIAISVQQNDDAAEVPDSPDAPATAATETAADATTAFFYQYVGPFVNGVGNNATRAGWSFNGVDIFGAGNDVLDWEQRGGHDYAYGDPVFSLLPSGKWAVTARGGGGKELIYGESSCPLMDDDALIVIDSSTASGCKQGVSVTMGKTSEVFSVDGSNYVFHMTGAEIYLAKLSDEDHSALDLESMCILEDAVADISEIGYGESAPILSSDTLLLSDAGIAQRTDGTWVLFVKGIERAGVCSGLCELCARKIYRTTSTDLLTWTSLEMVVEEASVPEAYTDTNGVVWLYWQDFSDVCAAQSEGLANIAPIASAYETGSSYTLSTPERVVIGDEKFQTDTTMHYATNGNPVALTTAAAQEAFAACLE